MVDKKVFAKRFKKAYKDKGYTQVRLALDLNVSTDTIKTWSSPNRDSIPKDMDMLSSIAKLLDVDVSYLLGEIDCKHYSEQTIVDVTGLSEKSASVLCGMGSTAIGVLDFLLQHDDFTRLMLDTWNYGHCHNKIINLIDKPLNDNQTVYNPSMIKFAPSDRFNKMLDDYYNSNSEDLGNVAVYYAIQQILGYLDDWEYNKNEEYFKNDKDKLNEVKGNILKGIVRWQDDIKKHEPNNPWVQINADMLIKCATEILDNPSMLLVEVDYKRKVRK
jgi:transcriptional regulator with XRE-family HTH domain